MSPTQQAIFTQRVEKRYPTLFEGLKKRHERNCSLELAELRRVELLGPGMLGFPDSPEKIRLFAEVLLEEALGEGYLGNAALLLNVSTLRKTPGTTYIENQKILAYYKHETGSSST